MGDNIRVLVATNTFPSEARPGDTPSIKDQVDDLMRLGVSVEILYIDSRRKINYLVGALKLFSLSFTPKKYDLIHAFYGHTGVLAKLQKKYPVIVTFLGSDLLGKKDSRIGRLAARMADGVIVMTKEMKKASTRQDARVIPFGANAAIFKPYSAPQARSELGLAQGKKLVLFPWDPARPVKRYQLAQEAVATLRAAYDVELLTIHNKAREIIAKYMSACDAMILTSSHEGSPLAVREALACHLPVVSVDVGDVRTIVESAGGGYIASEKASDLAEKISRVFEQPGAFFKDSSKVHNSGDSARDVLSFYKQIIMAKKR